MTGLILAAPSSGAGKTTITLGLLRALRNAGYNVRSGKSGPDYIDPQFHAAASGRPCVNLDAWAMSPERIRGLADGTGPLIVEGAMGLFDGAPPAGKGSTADLARTLDLPVVLIIDAKAMSHSVGALVRGFASHDPTVQIAGLILNRVGSPRHETMLRTAIAPLGLPVLGAIPRSETLSRPSRHLGLVQAGEMPDLDVFLETAAAQVTQHIDLTALLALMRPANSSPTRMQTSQPRRIALAQDAAFSFVYPHHIADWQEQGTTIIPFSPLADEAVPAADEVFLPGGYPELHAETLAGNQTFIQSLRNAAQQVDIYGECGGYMTLGETLIDADGTPHKMAGLLGLTTSFATRKLHLGYRTLRGLTPSHPATYTAHEFHYATTINAQGTPLFEASDAEGRDLGPIGLTEGRVSGSFAHIIDHA
ncbi:cobyrinate a,c-diamide synthase [Octadecabacter sp. 1_MG-2023]|uniref:cobyrinate a,c-diamide synthase n=1 Tax=unclassified Octadecabacter TaxID=196158 RepID=UPI001C08EDF7|nr:MULTISPECIES: cobyrinate a,c-diamide synthase [unclassified Octadecabacter]MBU2993404.1 cobyrinate a,c-diamide synthase [Octadecabacter sp. B2R22]MDO6733140.1 cobyrinate a,c-diamide synthase [Octadecabacter sp. 1_MG-2023]